MNWANTPFTDNIDPSKYASIILYLASEALQTSDIKYTQREQALEMLTQVLKGSKYAKSATKLLTELSIYNYLQPDQPLDPKFDVKNLALLLTDHLPDKTPALSINAVTTSRQAKPKFEKPKRFERHGPIQCNACQTNGHCIKVEKNTKQEDLRVCRIGGQIDNYLKWKEKNPELANANAKLYRAMNRRIVVNMVQTKHPNLDVSDELLSDFQDACEDIMFKENLPEDIQDS